MTVIKNRSFLALIAALALLAGVVVAVQHSTASADDSATGTQTAQIGDYVPPIKHVFVINIENSGQARTWGPGSAAPYLATTLRDQGVLLTNYYGTAHNSMPNYVAQVSGQGPNPDMQGDCQLYTNFVSLGTTTMGQERGMTGCVFPSSVKTIANQMTDAGLTWKGYMDGMASPCLHPALGSQDQTQTATATNQYATRHDPFMYFHSIIDDPAYCAAHVVNLDQMQSDLASVASTPNLSYITPDLCDDGHDATCADGTRKGGLAQVNAFLQVWVPRILSSPAFKADGMLLITADESDGPTSDAGACCGETSVNTAQAGITGAGGGVIGALVISRWTDPGTWSTTPYNHYALLASLEEIFRLPKLGYAQAPSLDRFGLDVYNTGWRGASGSSGATTSGTATSTPSPAPTIAAIAAIGGRVGCRRARGRHHAIRCHGRHRRPQRHQELRQQP